MLNLYSQNLDLLIFLTFFCYLLSISGMLLEKYMIEIKVDRYYCGSAGEQMDAMLKEKNKQLPEGPSWILTQLWTWTRRDLIFCNVLVLPAACTFHMPLVN